MTKLRSFSVYSSNRKVNFLALGWGCSDTSSPKGDRSLGTPASANDKRLQPQIG